MSKLQRLVKIFVAEKHWEGLEGLRVTDEMKVTVAGQASLMLLGIDNFYFDNVRSLLLFPRAFNRKDRETGQRHYRAGEAWQSGPILLSWRDSLMGGRNEDDGRNVVIHEFAHALDGLDGEMGGHVEFDDPRKTQRWVELVEREYEELRLAELYNEPTFLDPYGATSTAEFFAVASEAFFESPRRFKREKPELFEMLRMYYQVHPAQWQR